MSSENRRFWYLLVDSKSGNPYKNATIDYVMIPNNCVIADFRKAVKAENPNNLSKYDAVNLLVYKDKTSFERRNDENDKQGPLKSSEPIKDLGSTEDTALIVVVPDNLPSMDIDIPQFDASTFKQSFPFFDVKASDNVIEILGRDEIIRQINLLAVSRSNMEKYSPIIISTSRGMGKTFLLQKVGRQELKDELKCSVIGKALQYGRILSFDFRRITNAIENDDDVYQFFPRLMIFFLCKMFAGTQVSGIYFEEIETFPGKTAFSGKQPRFQSWLEKALQSDTPHMIKEYIRLTNEAFKTQCDIPPIFLLDEIQSLLAPTKVESKFDREPIMHTRLSLLLSQLARGYKPLCVCAGTNSGAIISITERSLIVPIVLSLTPLVKQTDYHKYWRQLTDFRNETASANLNMDNDEELILALVFASYQIPRLLFLAHETWFALRVSKAVGNPVYFLQNFEASAIKYYDEMANILKLYDVNTISHLILHCGVHMKIEGADSNVPGTLTAWSEFINKSLIFPYLDDCYIFPFTLVWKTLDKSSKNEIQTRCRELVGNLDINDLYFSFDTLSSWELYQLGIGFETLFASSIAVKYYLTKICRKNLVDIPFEDIYDFEETTKKLLDYNTNFSEGIFLPEKEVDTTCKDLPKAVVHNRKVHHAHHDIILPVVCNETKLNVAVSVKASFDLSAKQAIEKQLCVSPKTTKRVERLIWLYLGEAKREENFPDVAFLDGSGCCNGFSLDLLILVKKLKMKTNRFQNQS